MRRWDAEETEQAQELRYICSILSCRPATYDACIKRGNISHIWKAAERMVGKARFIIAFITACDAQEYSGNSDALSWLVFFFCRSSPALSFIIQWPLKLFFFPLLLSFSAHLPAPARAFYMTGTRIRYVVPWMSIACCTSTKAPSILISYLSLSFRSLPILFVPFFFFCRACRWRCSSTWIASRIDIYIYKQQPCEKYRTPLLRDFSDVPTRKDHPLVVDTLTNGNW